MEEAKYYVVLKENGIFTDETANKIRKMALNTYGLRFPFEPTESDLIEVYFVGTKDSCRKFIDSCETNMKSLFDIKPEKELTR